MAHSRAPLPLSGSKPNASIHCGQIAAITARTADKPADPANTIVRRRDLICITTLLSFPGGGDLRRRDCPPLSTRLWHVARGNICAPSHDALGAFRRARIAGRCPPDHDPGADLATGKDIQRVINASQVTPLHFGERRQLHIVIEKGGLRRERRRDEIRDACTQPLRRIRDCRIRISGRAAGSIRDRLCSRRTAELHRRLSGFHRIRFVVRV